MKRGFTLTELLVVISITGLLMGMLLPAVSRAREQAKVTVVNAELRQIGIALDMYFDDNRKFPPTHEDCGTGKLTDHLYQLPKALITSHYLPLMPKGEAMTTNLEDRYNLDHTYKYRSVGEIIVNRNVIEKYMCAELWIPNNFPASSSIGTDGGRWRPDANECNPYSSGNKSLFPQVSPVSWVVFSLGPRFSHDWLNEKLGADNSNRYPVPKELWYTPKERKGFIVRMRIKNGSQIGSFEGNR
jgi:prepilin-type N-terminal cleavage/methylation domain-containing protein